MKATLLYVEDNEQNFYLVRFLMAAHGYEVHRARDGSEGIASALSLRPDLILLDIQLPQMDGYAVARTLRASPEVGSTPIVALTSYALPGDRDRALQAGCVGYIEKPIRPAAFVAQIEAFLAQRRDGAPPR